MNFDRLDCGSSLSSRLWLAYSNLAVPSSGPLFLALIWLNFPLRFVRVMCVSTEFVREQSSDFKIHGTTISRARLPDLRLPVQ